MDIVSIILIGIGVAMDSSAVSMAGGANTEKNSLVRAAVYAAFFFGLFQGGMLLLGGLGGEGAKDAVKDIDHWVAFGLLAAVGSKMLHEARHTCDGRKTDLLSPRLIVLLAFATSIDALAVGVGVAFADHALYETAAAVAATTAVISFFSVFAGERYGCGLGGKAEALGGVVLVLIGINILISHLAGA